MPAPFRLTPDELIFWQKSLWGQPEKALFKNEVENFIVKATKETEEIQALLEVGFEFVCQKDSLMFFRKRK